MIKLQIDVKNESKLLTFDKDVISIGKSNDSDIFIKGWFVSQQHAVIKKLPAGYAIEDLDRGANGTHINGQEIDIYGPLKVGDTIVIQKCNIKVLQIHDGLPNHDEINQISDKNIPYENQILHHEVEYNNHIDDIANQTTVTPLSKNTDVNSDFLNIGDIDVTKKVIDGSANKNQHQQVRIMQEHDIRLMKELHQKLIAMMDLRRTNVAKMSDDELYEQTLKCLNDIVDNDLMIDKSQVERIKTLVLNEAVGLGPLEFLLADKDISEIMVNSSNEIYVERQGQIQLSPLVFSSDQAVLDIIERIVSPIGRRIDESSPMVDARLKDGSRVNAIIPPLAIKGPTITIRKFPEKRLSIDDLVQLGSISADMADFLHICVQHKKNVIISGGTGSGKTTLLNVLSNFIPNGERVITIEDAAELKLNHNHLISLESRPSNAEGKGLVTIRDLVKNSLRMRPDRIVVGECRSAEALDMLQAMNTGHEGSLTTLHANTPRDALARLETMILMAGMDLPLTAIREQIVSAIDIVVQQTRFHCGTRKVTHITEITGMEAGMVQMQDLFLYQKHGYNDMGKVMGQFMPQDIIPSFYQELKDSGIHLRTDYFSVST